MPKISYEKKNCSETIVIKSAKIAHFSKSPGVLESSKSRLFEFVQKKLGFAIFISDFFVINPKNHGRFSVVLRILQIFA